MQEMRWINFNMGCFEITFSEDILLSAVLINFNMGCFEISLRQLMLLLFPHD